MHTHTHAHTQGRQIGKKDKSQESVHFVQYLNNRSLEREQKKTENFQELKDLSF